MFSNNKQLGNGSGTATVTFSFELTITFPVAKQMGLAETSVTVNCKNDCYYHWAQGSS
jgi:hypothetical protein